MEIIVGILLGALVLALWNWTPRRLRNVDTAGWLWANGHITAEQYGELKRIEREAEQ